MLSEENVLNASGAESYLAFGTLSVPSSDALLFDALLAKGMSTRGDDAVDLIDA